MIVKTIKVPLKKDEAEFIEKLAEQDGISVNNELINLLRLQIQEEMELAEAIEKGEQ